MKTFIVFGPVEALDSVNWYAVGAADRQTAASIWAAENGAKAEDATAIPVPDKAPAAGEIVWIGEEGDE